MKLTVTHETRYAYEYPVEQAHHIAYLQPRDLPSQTLLSHELQIEPTPSAIAHSRDNLGQTRCYFELATPHDELIVIARSTLLTTPLPAEQAGKLESVRLPSSSPWERVAVHMRYVAGQRYDPAREFAQPSPLAPIHSVFSQYAGDVCYPNQSVYELARAICQRIYYEFTYSPEATDVSTPPKKALEIKQGVCQDFAQVMIASLRSLGLAARYVSGYLLTEPPPGKPRLVGADASHAWVSVYCPVAGWLEFDPTNNCLAGETHVRLAYGRDYGDVAPIRGVIRGGGEHDLDVAVTVAPDGEQPVAAPTKA